MRMISIENQFKSEPFYLQRWSVDGLLKELSGHSKTFWFFSQSNNQKGFPHVPHHLFLVCPVAIPEIFPQTQVSDY